MKSEWERKRISKFSDLCSIIGGGTPKTSVPEYWGGNIPWLSVKDFCGDRKFVYSAEKSITPLGLDNSSTKLLQEGDIIVSARGTVGELAMLGTTMAFNQSCFGLRAKDGIDSHYLYYLTKTKINELKKLSHGCVFDTITKETFDKVACDVPSLPIQRKIASILSALDDKIETNNAICRNQEEQARALYELWLSKRKNECEWLSLEAIADLNPEAYSIKEKWGYINYLDTGNITDGVISSIQKIDLEQDELPSRARRKVKAGDVVFSTVRPNQRHFGILHSPLPNMLVSTGFTVIRSNKTDISNELIYLLLSDSSFVEKMQQIGEQSVSAYPSVKPTDIATCQIPFMDSMDYFQMQKVICSMFSQSAVLKDVNRYLSDMRDTLLPKLMDGEIDLGKLGKLA